MTMRKQRERFLDVLHRHLADPSARAGFDWDVSLRGLGLNSMQAVDLVIELEEELDIMFPDDLFRDETFGTARALWEAIEPLVGTVRL
jgi:acyl carrier protein